MTRNPGTLLLVLARLGAPGEAGGARAGERASVPGAAGA